MQNINSKVFIDSLLLINTNLSSYKIGSNRKDRAQLEFKGSTRIFNNISGNINQVRSNNEYYQTIDFNTKLFSGSIHPVIDYKNEYSD